MSGHTKGPWIWRGKSGSLHTAGTPPYIYGDTVLEPSYEYDSGTDTIVSDADAALIAAAPEMLDALKAMVSDFEQRVHVLNHKTDIAEVEVVTKARAAIAKAEGRS